MHWVVVIGGQTFSYSGNKFHRASLQHCSPQDLGSTIANAFKHVYGVCDGDEPPPSDLVTYAVGFLVRDQDIIEDWVMPAMQQRLKNRNFPQTGDIYKDTGADHANLLSREKCMDWLVVLADHLDQEQFENKEFVLYEFSDRPEGFPEVHLSEEVDPWKHATVSMFDTDAVHAECPVGPVSHTPAAPPPPAKQGGASLPQKRQDAVATAAVHGAGPRMPDGFKSCTAEDKKEQKIAAIRAALHYNGYPAKAIEGMLQNKLRFYINSEKSVISFNIRLPNGALARSYADIDANPYPGGAITKKEDRKCHIPPCPKPFGHNGPCAGRGGYKIECNSDSETSDSDMSTPASTQQHTVGTIKEELRENNRVGEGAPKDNKEREESGKEEPRAESAIYLLTTTEELDNGDVEDGRDECSSLGT